MNLPPWMQSAGLLVISNVFMTFAWYAHLKNMASKPWIIAALVSWADSDQTGEVYDSSGGFILPDGAMRAPDAAWVRKSRLAALSAVEREGFLPLCPDFVIELRSPSDALDDLRAKMEAYLANGARLGWLLDPQQRRAYVYRAGEEVELLENPRVLSGAPELPGFVLDLEPIWQAV